MPPGVYPRIGDNSVQAVRMRRLLAEGRCARCARPKPPERRTKRLCADCMSAHAERERLMRRSARSARPCSMDCAAMIRCMKCGDLFDSPDRRKIRHCDRCRDWLDRMAEAFGLDGDA